MLDTRAKLHECIAYEKSRYNLRLIDYLTNAPKVRIMRYVRVLRRCEYHKNIGKGIHRFAFVIYRLIKNHRGAKLGIEIGENSCDKGLLIYHAGSVVINSNCTIGKNLKLHGSNCIGNNG